jgi:hypothetical protein
MLASIQFSVFPNNNGPGDMSKDSDDDTVMPMA